jgi:hypothetical protein
MSTASEEGHRRMRRKDSAHAFAVRLMQHLVVPTFVLDANGRVLIWNRACERLTGVPATDVLGTSEHWRAFYEAPRNCLADLLALGRADELDGLYLAHAVPGDSNFGLRAENWCAMPHVRKRLYLAIDAGPIYDEDGKLIAVVETLRDMTEQKMAQMKLQSLATVDALTGLANRRVFDETLGADWLCAQLGQTPLSLLMADIDHFKGYNDAYGHQKGDECLKAVAGAIGDQVFSARRYGGTLWWRRVRRHLADHRPRRRQPCRRAHPGSRLCAGYPPCRQRRRAAGHAEHRHRLDHPGSRPRPRNGRRRRRQRALRGQACREKSGRQRRSPSGCLGLSGGIGFPLQQPLNSADFDPEVFGDGTAGKAAGMNRIGNSGFHLRTLLDAREACAV